MPVSAQFKPVKPVKISLCLRAIQCAGSLSHVTDPGSRFFSFPRWPLSCSLSCFWPWEKSNQVLGGFHLTTKRDPSLNPLLFFFSLPPSPTHPITDPEFLGLSWIFLVVHFLLLLFLHLFTLADNPFSNLLSFSVDCRRPSLQCLVDTSFRGTQIRASLSPASPSRSSFTRLEFQRKGRANSPTPRRIGL